MRKNGSMYQPPFGRAHRGVEAEGADVGVDRRRGVVDPAAAVGADLRVLALEPGRHDRRAGEREPLEAPVRRGQRDDRRPQAGRAGELPRRLRERLAQRGALQREGANALRAEAKRRPAPPISRSRSERRLVPERPGAVRVTAARASCFLRPPASPPTTTAAASQREDAPRCARGSAVRGAAATRSPSLRSPLGLISPPRRPPPPRRLIADPRPSARALSSRGALRSEMQGQPGQARCDRC